MLGMKTVSLDMFFDTERVKRAAAAAARRSLSKAGTFVRTGYARHRRADRQGDRADRQEHQEAAGHLGNRRLGMLVKKPLAVYIEKVYEEGNFADLVIGT